MTNREVGAVHQTADIVAAIVGVMDNGEPAEKIGVSELGTRWNCTMAEIECHLETEYAELIVL